MDIYPFKEEDPKKEMPKKLLRMEGLFFCSRSSCSHALGQISEGHKREQNTTSRKVMDDIYLRQRIVIVFIAWIVKYGTLSLPSFNRIPFSI
ncbi:hypothetical protein CDAR_425381 [Caerostris darwini]|uniref:Uncharacterized protein n=1 Tax=Caerostris darwini TaxID=1538125 RepID=A0AAV4VJ39_9ARAC|nr:hypothetical protein CDAR_425381 [Caerostris darwini]